MKIFAAALAVVGLVAASSLGVVDVTLKANVGGTLYTDTVPGSAFSPGTTVTLYVYVHDSVAGSGVLGLGGDIVPSGASSFSTPTKGATWTAPYTWVPIYDTDGVTVIGQYKVYNAAWCFAGALPIFNLGDPGFPPPGYIYPATYTVAAQAPVVIRPGPNYDITNWNVGGVPAANGGMNVLGSGQAPSATPNTTLGNPTPYMVANYTFTWLSNSGPTTLSWIDAGKAGATMHGGWFTAGTAIGDDGVGTISNITFLPEPVTLSLLALGGLLATRRRRV